MTFSEYQARLRETVKKPLSLWAQREHSVFGIASKSGEITGILRRMHEGKPTDEDMLKRSVGEMLGYISELCDCYGWEMDIIAADSLVKKYGESALSRRRSGLRSDLYSREVDVR